MRILTTAGAYTKPVGDAPNHYVEHLSVPDLSVGTYSIPAGGVDDQTPHTEDEIYVVTAGSVTVTKLIQRQTLTRITVGGSYIGAQAGAYSGCNNTSNNGPYSDFFTCRWTSPPAGALCSPSPTKA